MEAIYSNTYIRYIVRAFVAFFSAMLLSAVLFSSLGYIDGAQAETDEVDVQVNVAPVLDLRVEKSGSVINELDLSVTPTSAGAFVKDDLDVIVNTSNPTGYTLTIADKDTDTAMHNTVTTITDTISSLAATATDTTFPANTWGYSIDSIASTQNFSPIPLSTAADTIKTTDAAATEDITPVTFGVNVDSTLSAGTYQDTVVFSAVTNYVPRGLETITTMQDMTPAICAASTIGDEAILTDTRDNKSYVVRKLKDGRCWMVQNLALGGTTPITLTPADSNVSANFTLSASSNSFGTTNDAAGININRMHSNGDTWITPITPGSDSTINTSGTPPSQTQYQGNYYNLFTATAGSGAYAMPASNQDTIQSICPKGWRLPTGGDTTSIGKSELQQLYDAYENFNDFVVATSAILSGHWESSSASFVGSYGIWWSSTAINEYSVYVLLLSNSGAVASDGNKRGGNFVRCIAENQDLTTISTMQQMTPSICAATPTPAVTDTNVPQSTLSDTRDGNTYVVRKLADGNCWMVQNLDLDLSTSVAFNSSTSDLSPGRTWTPQNNTQTTVGTVWAQNGGDVARSMNPGDIYFPGGVGTGTADAYENLQGSTTGEPWEFVGNYYNWYAATAGTGTAAMTEGQVATDSICPRGWKLPDNSGSKSFLNLVTTTYGLQDNNVTDSTKILQAPLNFVRGGIYHWMIAEVADKGAGGFWWSTTAASATNAYYLYTNNSRIIPQKADDRGHGFTIRCVAR